ncbi:ATP-binding protein [Aquabacterium sp. UBA2148]|uniref:ATP-binding protein n=1 Tax=Aquabacterium sp. UBA2148 TaxID=1946042 RepID=UPI002580C948|nr:ATP-binding protein [Aquabacterium sp. UBA2148]
MTTARIPLLMRPITRWAERLTFQQQLSAVVAVGVLSMTLLSSLASAWQASRQVRSQQLDQSLQVASSLAAQSRLALLSGSPDNVREAMTATLAFPDVLRIEVRTADHQLLASQGSTHFQRMDVPPAPLDADRSPLLAAEDEHAWYVVAPVWSEPHSTPFDVEPPVAERLGQVTVVLSKATLAHTVANIFLVNVGTSLVISVLFLGMLRWLSQRLSRPLQSLSQAMSRAEQGESRVRTVVQGPQDVQRMATAFNRMISALQERGDELQRHQLNLSALVRERTIELQEAKERAEVASQAKTDFLARMSHELRTPLNAILGYAQILQMDRTLTERQRHIVQTVHDSGGLLLRLIIDILDLSRIESGHTALVPVPVQPRQLAQQLHNVLGIKAQQKSLTLRMHCADAVPQGVLVDDQRLRQVLINLLGNALKFTQAGEVSLDIEPVPGTLAGEQVTLRFSVRDSGPGVRDADRERIFEPFEQAGDSHSRAQGTGLGLAISRQLVRLMGGDIHLDSREGAGSCFWFDLALPVVHAEAITAAQARHIIGYDGPRKLVLVVDDVTTNRQLLLEMLRPLGFDTLEAADGQEAVQLAQRCPPDLVLMDLAMPVLDGLSATRMLRATQGTQDIAVIALTANASDQHRQDAQQSGANAFLAKPFDRQELLDLIGQTLGLSWQREVEVNSDTSPDASARPPTEGSA